MYKLAKCEQRTYIPSYPTKHNSVIGDGDAKALASPGHVFIVVNIMTLYNLLCSYVAEYKLQEGNS